MKKLLVLLFSVSCLAAYTQDVSTPGPYKADVIIRNYRIQSSERTVVQPGFSFNWEMHNLRLAPNFQVYSSEARNKQYGFSFTGLSAAYQLRVKSALQFLEQHFEFESTTQFFATDWTANTYVPALDAYQDVKFESLEFFQSLTLGYGFIIKPGDHFYISQTTAAGIYFSDINGGAVDDKLDVEERIDFRGYDGFEAMIVISAGIGWDF